MLNLSSMKFNQSQSSTPGKPTNGGPVLKYVLSETIHAQENGSKGTHFVKFLISNFPKSLTYSAMPCVHPDPNPYPPEPAQAGVVPAFRPSFW